MRLYLDLDSRNFLESPSFPRALTLLELKRRDTDLLELQFLRDRVVQELPAGATVRLGLKPAGDYDADFFATGAFTKSGTGTSTKYLLDLNLNTVPLNAAFAASATEPETLAAMLEVEWTSGTTISSSKTLPVSIANDVIRGDEGTPAAIPDLKATQADAISGSDNTKWMTPLRVDEQINERFNNPVFTGEIKIRAEEDGNVFEFDISAFQIGPISLDGNHVAAPTGDFDLIRKIDLRPVLRKHTFSTDNIATPYAIPAGRETILKLDTNVSASVGTPKVILPRYADGAEFGDIVRIQYRRVGQSADLDVRAYQWTGTDFFATHSTYISQNATVLSYVMDENGWVTESQWVGYAE